MKIKKKIYFFFFNKRYYNPPSKRKWSKQNDKYKTRRPLAEKFNLHKINIKGEYWKQKHVNKQFVVENDNIDMINERTSLNFFGYPNISMHNKLGGSLYIEQMDEITLCVIMNKCIRENICDSFVWKSLLNRCTRIMNKMNGNILSYIFKYSSQSYYYNHYFFITMIGNISSHLYSFNLKNCSNILYAMNNNNNFYNEEIYKKIIEHCSLLILNRNDIDINSVLSIINSFYTFKNNDINQISNVNYNISKNINCAYLLFDSISKTFNKYDLDLCEIDYVCSSLLSLCLLDRINLFFQERNRNVINKLINYLNNNMEKLNIKHISILCFASCIFKNSEILKWKYIFHKIEKDCYLLNNNYISILVYSLKDKVLENKSIYNIIYNKIFDILNIASLENLSLITYSFLKYNNLNKVYNNNKEMKKEENNIDNYKNKKEEKKKYDYSCIKENKEVRMNYSFNLFNDFLYGKIKCNTNNFNIFQIFLIFKGLSETNLRNTKIDDLKSILLEHIRKNIYTIPIYLLSYFSKIITNNSLKDKELINSLKDVSLIYLNIYKYLYIEDSNYMINAKSSLIEDYYNTVSNDEHKIKSDITFLYNEKKKEINYLSEKYLINLELFQKKFKYLNENFDITKEQIEKTFLFSKNYFFNYYLKEKHLANFFYFCTLMDKEYALNYFNEIKTIIHDKIINKQLKFSSSSILYIFKALDHMNMIQKQNIFFNILLKQLCDEIFSLDISIFFEFLLIFYKNKISHYYFLKKAKYIINMNRYELSEHTVINMKNMICELNKLLY
ncbi:conserved Plasmodium protein, unknown function [Plasmodium relictum]|uniref:Uncharacterized protein n=1 Tax=Plasmodium relictum TaxID=85471 RepID=A0A1J1HF65_PLARL|nr:conserved Plasmodium protein, unknown function [Plasmodium relictum]CRH04040.1 conserved Plasmodium protein, unknown function [Plasmodium relictum]